TDDLEHLCWVKIALDAFGDRELLKSLDDKIVNAYATRGKTNWVAQNSYRQALTALALGTELRNYFRLPEVEARQAPDQLPSELHKPSLAERFKAKVRTIAIEAAGTLRPVPACSSVHIATSASYSDDLTDV